MSNLTELKQAIEGMDKFHIDKCVSRDEVLYLISKVTVEDVIKEFNGVFVIDSGEGDVTVLDPKKLIVVEGEK